MKFKNPSIFEIAYTWLDEKKVRLSPVSYDKYTQIINSFIEPFFRKITIEEVLNDDLLQFHRYIESYRDLNNKPICTGNKRIVYMILNNTLEYAYLNKLISTRLYVKPSLKKEKHLVKVFSSDEQKKLETYLFANPSLYSAAILLALYSGIRIGEICALQWSHVDLHNSSLKIVQSVKRIRKYEESSTELIVLPPKSSSSYRVIPIPNFISAYLQMYSQKKKHDDYVFSKNSDIPLDIRTLQYAYKGILNNAGVSYLNFHCLRHTFATRCITLGWDMKTLSEVLGHSDINITMEYYFHSSFEYKQKQMNKLCPL